MKKQVIGIFLLITLCSILLVNFVSAQNAAADSISTFFSNIFTKWQAGSNAGAQVDVTTIKVFLFIILSLLVFSILDTVDLIRNKPALFVISAIVGIISTYYMSQTEIVSITSIYTAFGGAFVTLLPFLILGSFTTRAVMDGNVQLMVMQHIAWGLFSAFLLYSLLLSGQVSDQNVLVWTTFGLSVVLTVANGFILEYFGKIVMKAKAVAAAQTITDISLGMDIFRGAGKKAEGKK